eukprot:CAMPEP_0197024576 /NCGR_PEP_ID=MMETSP1384-20130603/5089_1 /TAXON_ID=29189 /ORGANISM="Ammonia sp." /LENGTH=528 /DNA_ID=CAMNT_0042452979 /DNA_START=61 /DNA_END=1647 /DNA_ORIENTATION=+
MTQPRIAGYSSCSTPFTVLLHLLLLCQRIDAIPSCLEESPKYQEKYMKPILSSLSQKGYTIHHGYLYWKTNETKHGGNPASSYGMWYFPNTSINLRPSPETGTTAILLHPSDAILFTGCTAPTATYIGFENYVYAKYNPANDPNASMAITFNSLGGAVNQYLINTSSIGNSSSSNNVNDADSAFNAMTTLITTGDKVTYRDIFDEYKSRNLASMVNDYWIPSQYFNFIPYNFTAANYTVLTYPGPLDSYMGVTRIMNHLEQQEWSEYVASRQPCYWLTAEKIIRNHNETKPREAYTELYVRNATSSRDESEYAEAFSAYVNDTIAYFENMYKMQLIDQRTVVNYNLGAHDYGYSCYDNNWNCQGDLRDEQYWGTHNGTNVIRRHPTIHAKGTYNLRNSSYFLMMGVNHMNTNMTIYDNVILYYEMSKLEGLYEPIFMVDSFHYNNSCLRFNVSTTVKSEIVAKFYMVQIARPWLCDDKDLPGICPDFDIVQSSNAFAMYTRNLLNLETLTRPSELQIIPDVLLHFKVL